MPWSAWHSLTSTGLIAHTPAAGFQFKYAIDITMESWQLEPVLGDAHFDIEIVASDNTTLFRQTVTFHYVFVSLVIGPAVFMFTWWADLQNAHVTTTVPASPATIGGEQPYGDFSYGTGDVVMGMAHMMWDYYSGLYLVSLPAGAKLRVRRANIGLPDLRDSDSAIQVRVLEGGGLSGARLMQDGMTRLLRQRSGGGLEFVASCDVRSLDAVGEAAWPYSATAAPATAQITSTVTTHTIATQGLLFYLHEIAPLVLYQEGNEVLAKRSGDDGRSWGAEMVIATGVKMVAAEIGPDGGTIYLVGMRGSAAVALVCSFERDETGAHLLRATDEFPATGLSNLPTSLQFLKLQNNVAHLIVDQGGTLEYFRSTDSLRTWL